MTSIQMRWRELGAEELYRVHRPEQPLQPLISLGRGNFFLSCPGGVPPGQWDQNKAEVLFWRSDTRMVLAIERAVPMKVATESA